MPRCHKVRHPSRAVAVIVLKRLKNAGMRAYYCPECKAWHIGNSSERKAKVDRMAQLLSSEYREQMIQKYRRRVASSRRPQEK